MINQYLSKEKILGKQGDKPLRELSEDELSERFEFVRLSRDINKSDVARALSFSRHTYYARENKPSDFKLDELLALKELFEVDSIDDIFNMNLTASE